MHIGENDDDVELPPATVPGSADTGSGSIPGLVRKGILPARELERAEAELERQDRLQHARRRLQEMQRRTPTLLIVGGAGLGLVLILLLVYGGFFSTRLESVTVAGAQEIDAEFVGTREDEDHFMVEIRNTEKQLAVIMERYEQAEKTFLDLETGLQVLDESMENRLTGMIRDHKSKLSNLLDRIRTFIIAEGYREAGLSQQGTRGGAAR
ncbi:MAG: hypothetical protein ACOCXA_01570 [Planctomycetota bacterium]